MQSRRTIFRLTVNFRINDVSWRTAQSTGAFSYLPYGGAQEYSDIYDQQNDIDVAGHQAVRDTVIAVAPFLNLKAGEPNPSVAEAVRIKNNFEVFQGQLSYVESLIVVLDGEYKKFLVAHPN